LSGSIAQALVMIDGRKFKAIKIRDWNVAKPNAGFLIFAKTELAVHRGFRLRFYFFI
jgi:hypothetical protein